MPDLIRHPVLFWIPAFAGMTDLGYLIAGVISRVDLFLLFILPLGGIEAAIVFFLLPDYRLVLEIRCLIWSILRCHFGYDRRQNPGERGEAVPVIFSASLNYADVIAFLLGDLRGKIIDHAVNANIAYERDCYCQFYAQLRSCLVVGWLTIASSEAIPVLGCGMKCTTAQD